MFGLSTQQQGTQEVHDGGPQKPACYHCGEPEKHEHGRAFVASLDGDGPYAEPECYGGKSHNKKGAEDRLG